MRRIWIQRWRTASLTLKGKVVNCAGGTVDSGYVTVLVDKLSYTAIVRKGEFVLPVDVSFSEYGPIGGYVSGTFSGQVRTYTDSANWYPTSGTFRVKRTFQDYLIVRTAVAG